MSRLFVSIPLPQNVRWALQAIAEEYLPRLPKGSRPAPSDQLHFTLFFIGETEEKNIAQIEEVLRKVISGFVSPHIEIKDIVYGPSNFNPRMLWAKTSPESSVVMGSISRAISAELLNRKIPFFHEVRSEFTGHITLVRFPDVSSAVLPELDERVDFSFEPKQAELAESVLFGEGAAYTTRATFDFSGTI